MYGKDKRLNHSKGKINEELAAAFLKNKGYSILERNYRLHRNEIDIIALDKGCHVFVEVKARYATDFGYGFQAVNERKSEIIRRVAEAYLIRNGLSLYDTQCRFDIISIDNGILRHYINAF